MTLSLASTVTVSDGVEMPRLGFGTYKALGDEVERAVATAIEAGYRLIDTASVYTNEQHVGAALRASGLSRDELFITTKVWNDEQGYEQTREALARSLERLGLDHVDLYLVHWPRRDTLEATWHAMESLLAEGLTRAIGVSNFLPHHLESLARVATVPPAVDQVEFHPWLQQPALQSYLAEHDIALEAWAPLMKGHLSEEPLLARIGQAHGVTAAQVALRWILEQGHVAIPKSVHPERIRENADVFGFELTNVELQAISDLDRGHRFGPDPDTYAW
jgi:diketogulonate reductase-like aldo/keto reductase